MLLNVTNLDVSYGAVKALHGLSLEVDEGEIVTLIGCNGAGKSTTLRAVSGMLRPRGGSIAFEGQNVTGIASHKLVERGLSHVPEGRGIFANLTVAENLALGAYARKDRQSLADDHERALVLFPRVKERLKQLAGTLSGGEQQMLAIARALVPDNRLLLIDEPSEGLAPVIIEQLMAAIRQFSADKTVLLVEQNFRVASKLADRYVIIDDGHSVMAGLMSDLVRDEATIHRYLGVA